MRWSVATLLSFEKDFSPLERIGSEREKERELFAREYVDIQC
jgi:hypothetical protein